jgi:hypothetical protein
MVRRVETFAVCDVCGTEGAGHREVALDGVAVELDLCAQDEMELGRALAPYLAAARLRAGS